MEISAGFTACILNYIFSRNSMGQQHENIYSHTIFNIVTRLWCPTLKWKIANWCSLFFTSLCFPEIKVKLFHSILRDEMSFTSTKTQRAFAYGMRLCLSMSTCVCVGTWNFVFVYLALWECVHVTCSMQYCHFWGVHTRTLSQEVSVWARLSARVLFMSHRRYSSQQP